MNIFNNFNPSYDSIFGTRLSEEISQFSETPSCLVQNKIVNKTKLIAQDFADWNDAYSRHDYGAIMRSRKLFWLTFCKEVCDKSYGDFCVFEDEGDLIVSGDSKKSIEETVNKIRKFFLKSFEEKRVIEIVFIKAPGVNCFIRNKEDTVDLKNWLHEKEFKVYCEDFFRYIKPYMDNLACSLQADFTKAVISQNVDFGRYADPSVAALEAEYFKISWKSESYLVYPIEKKEIATRDDILDNYYTMYLKGNFCDLQLVTKEDEILNVHSLLMYSRGGEVLQRMLTCGMKEASQKIVYFSEFSVNTVKAYVDFIYLGEKGVTFDSLKERNLDLCELLHMAHTYQDMSLVDHCTNLISCFCDEDNLETIMVLADLYENAHLKKLYDHFLQKLMPSVSPSEGPNSSLEQNSLVWESFSLSSFLEFGFQF